MPTPRLHRVAACGAALAAVLAGALSASAAARPSLADGQSARAALRVTDYAYQSNSWAARVTTVDNQIRTTRLPYSYLACTRQVGKVATNALGEPLNSGGLEQAGINLAGLSGTNATYQAAGGRVGSRATNRIGDIFLEPPLPPGAPAEAVPGRVVIDGLVTKADAFHVRPGSPKPQDADVYDAASGFGAATSFDFNTFKIELPQGTPLDPLTQPAQELIDLATGTVNDQVVGQIIDLLANTPVPIEIPGVASFDLGFERATVNAGGATAGAYGLLIAFDNGGPRLELGRSHAAITGGATSGVIRGRAYTMKVQAAPGAPGLGEVGVKQIPCIGTKGRVRSWTGAALDFAPAQVEVAKAKSSVWGRQLRRGRISTWQQSEVTLLNLGGQVTIRGIVGRANAFMNSRGKVTANAKGTGIGSISIGGNEQPLPEPGEQMTLPGGEGLRTGVVRKTRRGIVVSAVVISLSDGSSLRVGNAQVFILRK